MAKLFDDDELYFEEYKKTSKRNAQTRQDTSGEAGKRKQTKKQGKKQPLYKRLKRKRKSMSPLAYRVSMFFALLFHYMEKLLKSMAAACAVFGAVALLAAGIIVLPRVIEWKVDADRTVKESTAASFQINESSTVYDSTGAVLATLRESADQKYVPYEEIPEYVVNAYIAVEDRTFWKNPGIDLKGIIRVAVGYITSKGEEVHGASTITQQLARNVYLTHEVSIERKGKEIFLALALADKYSKEEIMEFYVNNVCYANGIYGIAGAARAYFDKDVDELTLSECAYLCAIPNSPTYYDPYVYPERALERRNKILGDMLEVGFITEEEYAAAVSKEIHIQKPTYEYNDYETTYAADCAVRYLMELDGFRFEYEWDTMAEYESYQEVYNDTYAAYKHKLYTGGYQIYTSLDTELSASIQGILDEQLSFNTEVDENTGIYAFQGAITVVDNKTRKVVGIVGGRTQEETDGMYGLNRAYQSYRQPGSTFKPIAVYTQALMNGYTASSTVENINVKKAREPGVDVQSLTGTKMTLRRAVERSQNGVAWKLFDELTPSYALGFVTDMHFARIVPDDYYDAASLGGLTYGVTTVEMAEAYSTLVNHGDHVDATCIVFMKDSAGNEIYEEPSSREIYTDKAADDMVDILKGVLTSGTASSLRWSRSSDIEAFAKTGTTNDSKDGWFCGSTPYYSIAVWVGYDTPKTLSDLYGSSYPARIWKDSMLAATEGLEAAAFERNNEDVSYAESLKGTSYYDYLPGREDSEVLSSGYTVADYRADRVTGEGVTEIIQKMSSISGVTPELQQLYADGCLIIESIYSVSYTAELQATLDAAYVEAANRPAQ